MKYKVWKLFLLPMLVAMAFLPQAEAQKPTPVKWVAPTKTIEDHAQSLLKAVEFLSKGKGYPAEYLATARKYATKSKAGSIDKAAFEAFKKKALLANPLLNKPLLMAVHFHDYVGTHTYGGSGTYKINNSKLVLYHPVTGQKRVLLENDKAVMRRPDVSYDADKILYSVCVANNEKIFELEIDPKNPFAEKAIKPKQLTFSQSGYDTDSICLPDGSIVFSSTRDYKIVPCDKQRVPQLFRMDADGANIRQITRSTVHEMETSVLEDGRILYSRWDYVDRNFADGHGFWVTNPDGTDQAIYWGNNTVTPVAPWTARQIPGTRKLVCTIGNHHGSLGGAVAIIDPTEAIDGAESILQTWPASILEHMRKSAKVSPDYKGKGFGDWKWSKVLTEKRKVDPGMLMHVNSDPYIYLKPYYYSPYPLNENFFLASRANSRGGSSTKGKPSKDTEPSLYLIDTFGNELELYSESPGVMEVIPFAPRKHPQMPPTKRDYKNDEGTFFVQNVYQGTHMQGVKKGEVKTIRLVEALARHGMGGNWKSYGSHGSAVNWSDFYCKNILGTAPVEEDGSAFFMAPSDTFFYFQLLDKNGKMVQTMRSGTSIHSGEKMSCVGCHESRVKDAPITSKRPLALRRAASKLKPWFSGGKAFSYQRDVQPVFDKYCVKCHDFDKPAGKKLVLAGDRTFAFNASYSELWSKDYVGALGIGPGAHLPAKSWGSLQSPLIKHLESGHQDLKIDKESMNRLITWIDINGPYYPTTYVARSIRPGRSPIDQDKAIRLGKLCGFGAKSQSMMLGYKKFEVSFDRPEISPCLKKLKKGSVEYKEALAIIEEGKKIMQKAPRADMEGFVASELCLSTINHRREQQEFDQKVRAAMVKGEKIYEKDFIKQRLAVEKKKAK